MTRVACAAAVIASFASVTQAQEAETQNQFWPEIDVYVPLKPKLRLFFLGTVTKEETGTNLEGQLGAHIDFLIDKKFTLRAGYRYGFSLSGADPYKEHRIVLEQTFRHELALKVLLSDRNRQDLRVVNGNFSARYRNRVTLEREFSLGKFHVTPYASGEIYYDSRFNTWNRNRLAMGIQVPLRRGFAIVRLVHPKRVVVMDIYILRQNDSRSEPARIKGLGLALNLYL